MQRFATIYEKWAESGEISSEITDISERELDNYLETELDQIDDLVIEGKVEVAFGRIMNMTHFVNALSTKKPKIIRTLGKSLKKLHSSLKSIAQKWSADTFTISIGFPSGVSVSLSFKV